MLPFSVFSRKQVSTRHNTTIWEHSSMSVCYRPFINFSSQNLSHNIIGYLAAQWPGHYLMQRLPFGKFVAGLVFMWGATILLHCVATKYAGLVVLRIALGAAESVVVPAMEMTIGMFFNRHEQSFLQPFLWVTSALAPVCAAFISYGLLWSHSAVLPWKLFMIVTGGLSVVLSVFVWFFYPNNPAEARFLTLEEKVHSIKRVH